MTGDDMMAGDMVMMTTTMEVILMTTTTMEVIPGVEAY